MDLLWILGPGKVWTRVKDTKETNIHIGEMGSWTGSWGKRITNLCAVEMFDDSECGGEEAVSVDDVALDGVRDAPDMLPDVLPTRH